LNHPPSGEQALETIPRDLWGKFIFDNSAVGIAVAEPGGRFLTANSAYQRMTGYTEAELRELTLLDLTEEADRPAAQARQDRLARGEARQYQAEKRFRCRDDRVIWVRMTVSLAQNGPDLPAYVLMIAEDITMRKYGEEELQRSEAYLAAGQRLSHTGSWAWNLSTQKVFWSQETFRIFGFEPAGMETILMETFLERIHPEDRPTVEEELNSASAQTESYGMDYRIVLPDGTIRDVHDVVYPVGDSSGKVVERYGVVMDVTGRKRAEEALQRSRDQLRALAARIQRVQEEERTRLAREIHDELGQILTGIKIGLKSLLDRPPQHQEERTRRFQALIELIDGAFDSVRTISAELRPGMLDDLGLVAAVEWAAREFASRTQMKLALELPPKDLTVSPEIATAFFRILQEALTNIARHAEATELDVHLADEQLGLRLKVHDNGKGFQEAQPVTVGSLGILGMRERALLLGGQLTIRSSPSEGTTVTAWIPRVTKNEGCGE
jgi:PAS domain S-box-containing protein